MNRYRISSTGASSDKYGNCECCGKHATEVFLQVEEVKYEHGYYRNADWFGHKECLLKKRKKEEIS